MAKYPREEISYIKLYKKISLNRPLNIDWPEKPKKETIYVDETVSKPLNIYVIDEFDYNFISDEKIDEQNFIDYFKFIDDNFNNFIKEQIDYFLETKSSKESTEVKNSTSFNQINEKKLNDLKYCDICGHDEGKKDNLLVKCEGCSLFVHQYCYGIPEFQRNRWLCTGCIYYFDEPKCDFCSVKDGVLKRVNKNKWIHCVCALLNPSVSFVNKVLRDPLTVSIKSYTDSICEICKIASNNLLSCYSNSCEKYYHLICASQNIYSCLYQNQIYCERHQPYNNKELLSMDYYKSDRERLIIKKRSYKKSKDGIFLKLMKTQPFIVKKDYNPLNQTNELVEDIKPGLMNYDYLNESKLNSKDVEDVVKNDIKIKEDDILLDDYLKDKIEKYWLAKRKKYGVYFIDKFMFSNYLMNPK